MKEPIFAMSLLLAVRARDHRGLDGDLKAEGDRRRTRKAGRSVSGGWQREAFLPREEWAKPRGRKPIRGHCGIDDRGAAGLRRDQAKERTCAPRVGAISREGMPCIGSFQKPPATIQDAVNREQARSSPYPEPNGARKTRHWRHIGPQIGAANRCSSDRDFVRNDCRPASRRAQTGEAKASLKCSWPSLTEPNAADPARRFGRTA